LSRSLLFPLICLRPCYPGFAIFPSSPWLTLHSAHQSRGTSPRPAHPAHPACAGSWMDDRGSRMFGSRMFPLPGPNVNPRGLAPFMTPFTDMPNPLALYVV
jgi:hypothetical protein